MPLPAWIRGRRAAIVALVAVRLEHSPSSRDSLEWCSPRSVKPTSEPVRRSTTVREARTWFEGRERRHALADVDRDASNVSAMQLDFPAMQPGPYLKSERLHTVADRAGTTDFARRAVKRCERTVASRFDPGATKAFDFSPHEGVVIIKKCRANVGHPGWRPGRSS